MNTELARFNMIEQQIRPWDVLDQSVLSLLAVVRRELFVPTDYRALAFMDTEIPLPGLGVGAAQQFMFSPKMEARMLQELAVHKHETVLEIGTGSGYMAALLGHKARQVLTLEIDAALAVFAGDNLRRSGTVNVMVQHADGAQGQAASAPYDVIMLSGSVPQVPAELLQQLKIGGRLAAVVGQLPIMRARIYTRTSERDFGSVDLFDTVVPRLSGFDEPSRFTF